MNRFWRFLTIFGIGAAAATACADTPSFDQIPDRPEDFGYKVNWFAVRASDLNSVVTALEIGSGAPANWASGMAAAYGRTGGTNKGPWIFLSPPVNGWIFVVGSSLPYPVMHTPDRHGGIGQKFDTILSRLTDHFSEVQFFGSYRVVGFVAWVRAQRDLPLRVFSFGDGEVYTNIGNQTLEEARLKFLDLSGLSPRAASERLFSVEGKLPDETNVLQLAALWSLDPGKLSEIGHQPSLGLVVQLPKALAQ
ncbi:hypothetical protein [Dechloromonas denitrificans]|uniref:hypothetical protein n=1 Tax=Dechloromonas denitrificans TaxID=281362 RepID=UPI0012F8440D|nr:hypothetical protein [Dechloromonas denitrificans]